MALSSRIKDADAAFSDVKHFYSFSRYSERRLDPAICDFTFGNPHREQAKALVAERFLLDEDADRFVKQSEAGGILEGLTP